MANLKIINTPKLLENYTSPPVPSPIKSNGNIFQTGNIQEFLTTKQGHKINKNAYNNKRVRKSKITQIFLHHTAGWPKDDKGASVIRTFNQRVFGGKGSTHCVIDKNGIIERCVPEDRIAYAQGNNNKFGLSVELMALGKVTKSGNKFIAYDQDIAPYGVTGARAVKFDGTTEYTFRNNEYYQAYTGQQCVATVNLIEEWCYRYNIKFVFDQKAYDLMFPPLGQAPIKGKSTPGVFSHCSVRPSGKSDIYPDKTLINLFKKKFGKNDITNPTVSSFNSSVLTPKDLPDWNPTEMVKGNTS